MSSDYNNRLNKYRIIPLMKKVILDSIDLDKQLK